LDEPAELSPLVAPTGPVCAVHEGAPATGTCERCGNFVCPLCLDTRVLSDLRCAACRARGGTGQIPWESGEGSWAARWWQTCRAVIFQPTHTFSATRPGSVGAALGFVAVTGAFMGVLLGALGACALGALLGLGSLSEIGVGPDMMVGVLIAVIVIYPILVPIGLLFSVALRALIYHAGIAMFGGQGGIGTSFWVVSYLHAIHLTALPLLVIQQIPIIGPLIGLAAYVGIEIYYALVLTNAARNYHGLEGGRASLAGWLGFIVMAVLATTCCLFAMMFALAPAFMR
jgi:hypothetical protein